MVNTDIIPDESEDNHGVPVQLLTSRKLEFIAIGIMDVPLGEATYPTNDGDIHDHPANRDCPANDEVVICIPRAPNRTTNRGATRYYIPASRLVKTD